jgi:hypothetical protein
MSQSLLWAEVLNEGRKLDSHDERKWRRGCVFGKPKYANKEEM